MKVYPKAQFTLGLDKGPPNGGTPRGNMHTTETPSSGFYTRTVYYSIQVREYADLVYWRQFIDLEDYSHALRHNSGDPETNKEGSVNPSLAVVGYAKNMPLMSDLLVKEIAEFMVWCEKELGIPARFVSHAGGGHCYGENSSCRVSWSDWKAGKGPLITSGAGGWYTHAQVPGQTHWDAPFPFERIEAAIALLKAGQLPPSEPGLKEGMLELDIKLPVLKKGAGMKSSPELKGYVQIEQGLLLSQGFADRNTTKPLTYCDGLFWTGTETAVKGFQKSRGLSVDGVIGTGTWNELLRQGGNA